MEKLIKLLNKYETKAVVHWYEWYGQDVLMCRYIKDNFEFYTDEAATIAISKYYGFIEWLVENNKIDFGKLIMIKDEEQKAIVDIDNSRDNTLLMLLAIQDKPIDFLIEILK